MKKANLIALFGATVALATGVAAYAATYNYTNLNDWHLSVASRPAHLTGTLVSVLPLGSCNEANGVNCPHNGEELSVTAVAKTSAGVVMNGWNWITCESAYESGSGRNDYFMAFMAEGGTWPAVLPTGCNGGPCPQWPATVKCTLVGDNPAGNDNWTGNTVTYEYDISPSIDTNWVSNPLSTIVLATGKTLTLKASADNCAMAAQDFVHNLPAGTYTDATIQAKKSGGATWPGVKCIVDEMGSGTVDTIEYVVEEGAAAGINGYCTINGTNSPVTVVRQ
jgi:hypothetical protein